MSIRVIQIDAFTERPFAGNPAAVALLDNPADDELLQAIAEEMNLSETAFPRRRDDGDWNLRWFTPATEVELCGHATLATVHALTELGLVDAAAAEIRFHTLSGVLTCWLADDGIVMDFPASPPEPCEPIEGLAEALGVEVVDQARSFDVLAQLESAEVVAGLQPDLGALADVDTRAVIVTAAGDVEVGSHDAGPDGGPADFVSRVFAPRVGIAEDPVTGSAHCITGPWWAERLSKEVLEAHQVSARGGRMTVALRGDRVELTGQAVTVLDGTLQI